MLTFRTLFNTSKQIVLNNRCIIPNSTIVPFVRYMSILKKRNVNTVAREMKETKRLRKTREQIEREKIQLSNNNNINLGNKEEENNEDEEEYELISNNLDEEYDDDDDKNFDLVGQLDEKRKNRVIKKIGPINVDVKELNSVMKNKKLQALFGETFDPNKYNFVHELMTEEERKTRLETRLNNMDEQTTQAKYGEYTMRLMLDDIKNKKKMKVYIADVLIHTPEYQDYENELERNIKLIDLEYSQDLAPECELKTHRYIKMRNKMIDECTKKHYKRVNSAFAAKFEEMKLVLANRALANGVTPEQEKKIKQILGDPNYVPKNSPKSLSQFEDEFDNSIKDFLNQQSSDLDMIPEELKDMVQRLLKDDDYDSQIMALASSESENDAKEQAFETVKAQQHKQEPKQQKTLSFADILQEQELKKKQSKPQTPIESKNYDDNDYFTDGDFDLKDILNNMNNNNNNMIK